VQSAAVAVDGQPVPASFSQAGSQAGGEVILTLAEPITLRAGQTLTVTLS